MRLLICFLLVLLMQSCTDNSGQKEPFKSLLIKCTEVNFNFYNGGDTVHFNTEDSLGIKYLTQAVTGNSETISDTCKTAGELYYRAKGDTLLRTEFAVLPGADRKTCAYMIYNYQGKTYKHRLTEKVHQLLVQMYPKPSVDTTNHAMDSIVTDSVVPPTDSAKNRKR
jgi:hypothetical protein